MHNKFFGDIFEWSLWLFHPVTFNTKNRPGEYKHNFVIATVKDSLLNDVNAE